MRIVGVRNFSRNEQNGVVSTCKTVPNQLLCNSFIYCRLKCDFFGGLEVPDCTSFIDIFDTTTAVLFLALNPKTGRVYVECVIVGGSHLV